MRYRLITENFMYHEFIYQKFELGLHTPNALNSLSLAHAY